MNARHAPLRSAIADDEGGVGFLGGPRRRTSPIRPQSRGVVGVGTRSGSGAEQARSIWSVTVRQGVSGGTGCRAAKPSMGRLAWQSADDRLSVRLPSLYVSVGRRYLASRH